jgi:organic radical activating enzyme
MFGDNPIRPPLKGEGNELEVQEIFTTMQGEGPHAGMPAVFIRLGGCNLACSFCDAEFETFDTRTVCDLVDDAVSRCAETETTGAVKLVVITGGEPLRQPIGLLCDSLIERGLQVQLETNGTLLRPLDARVDMVCSPKNTGNGYARMRADVLERATAIKFIVSVSRDGYQDIAEVGQTDFEVPVYIQPMDEYDESKNNENLEHARKLVMLHGARLSVQLHKLMGIE